MAVMLGATKVEAVEDLISVVNFDPTEGLALVSAMCPDCEGSAGRKGYGDDPDAESFFCATCEGSGKVTLAGWKLENMTQSFRRNIQDIGHDNKGRLKLVFRNKDKAAAELKALLGWDKPGAMTRNAAGMTLTEEQLVEQQALLEVSTKQLTKERLIADMMELAESPVTSPGERLNILKTVAQLKGYITETGDTPPAAPPFASFYDGTYPPKRDVSDLLPTPAGQVTEQTDGASA